MATILVVDDDAASRRLVSYILQRNHHTPIPAGSAQEALDWLEENSVEMAVMDIAMPVMDGLALLHQIRSNPRLHSLPVLVLTSSGHEHARVVAGMEGANGFLTKPLSSQDLLEAVEQLLAKSF